MSHFARVVNGIVEEVIVAEQDFVDGLPAEPGTQWIQTSYNTHAGQHLLGGTPLRKNFAGQGYLYNSTLDAFMLPQPYPQWILNELTAQWEAPYPPPETQLEEGQIWVWNEYTPGWEARAYYQ
jgi:hypothetical protein